MNNVADTGCATVIILLAICVMIAFAYRDCDESEGPSHNGGTWTHETHS